MTNVCIYYKGVTGQKGENFSASFNAECLVVSKKMTTLHTHTICAPIGSVILFHFFLRARKERVFLISKGLAGVPFASLFVPFYYGIEKRNNNDFSAN